MAGLFDEIAFRGMTLKNRIMVSPMCQYQADASGKVNEWHSVHYGSFALGGPSLVMVEATAVETRGRISEQDLGIWGDEHVSGLAGIVRFAHKWGTKIGVQLCHAGRKADLSEEIYAPSALAFSTRYKQPTAFRRDEIQNVVEAFAKGAERAVQAGFDVIEIHGAHGYLVHQFLSPLSNQRSDEYGGSQENRLRFPLEVVKAVRQVVPGDMPVFIRVSGSEYAENGYTMEDMIAYCSAFREAGIDLVDVSSGGNVPVAPATYPGYQVPFAHEIKQAAGVPVASVGILDNPILADSVVREGRADMIAIARGFLRDKHWAHHAAQVLGSAVEPPTPYKRAY